MDYGVIFNLWFWQLLIKIFEEGSINDKQSDINVIVVCYDVF